MKTQIMSQAEPAGFTLVEILVALSITTIATFGLGWSFSELAKNKVRMETVSAITALESALTDELQKESNYERDAIKDALRNGDVPAELEFIIVGESMGQGFNFRIRPNGPPLAFDRRLASCNTFPSDDCRYQLVLRLQRDAVDGRMAYAYQIRTAEIKAAGGESVAVNFKGAGAGAAINEDVDYGLTIPYEYYLDTLMLECPPGKLGVSGINRETGTVACIAAPSQPCPPGTLPKAIRSLRIGTENAVEFVCGDQALQLQCLRDFALLDMYTQSLDPKHRRADQKRGRCVRIPTSSATYPTKYVGKRVSGQVCPTGYISTSTCSLINVRQRAGSCSPWCSGSTCGSESIVESPTGTFTRTTNYVCSDSTPLRMPANAGRIRGGFPGNEINRRDEVDCRVHYAQQDCGATWDADVEVTVSCQWAGPGSEIRNAF